MREHHQRAIQKFVEHMQTDPNCLAVIVGGSIAKELESENSDVDVMMIVSEEEFARRESSGELAYWSPDFTDYPGGYVDGKFISVDYMEKVARCGSEPARAAFDSTFIAWSKIPGLEELLARTSAYPEHEREGKMQSFVSQLLCLQWYAQEAQKRNDRYLMDWAAVRVVLFGYRLILAHNRILFPYHKWLTAYVQRAPEKPEQLLELADQVLQEPTREHIDTFCDCILKFREWEMPPKGWPNRFMEDTELTWLNGRPPVEDY